MRVIVIFDESWHEREPHCVLEVPVALDAERVFDRWRRRRRADPINSYVDDKAERKWDYRDFDVEDPPDAPAQDVEPLS